MASNSIQETPTEENAQRIDYGPPTSSSGSSGFHIKPGVVRMRMEHHHIYRNSKAFDRPDYSEFKEYVLSTIILERASDVEPGEKSRFKEIHKICVSTGATKATYKREMLEHIIKNDIEVLIGPGDPSQGIQPLYESRNILKSGVFCQDQQPLRPGLLPHNYPTDQLFAEDLAGKLKADGMANSIPDSTWGYLRRVLDPIPDGAMIQSHTSFLLTICPGLFCPFFLLEVEPDSGSMEVCRNKAARGCATVINAMRSLLRMLGREDTIGPDKDTYVYCATMGEDFMEWWVGWAEVCEGGRVNWYMNCLRREGFDQDDPLLAMRRFTHNILEWGLTTRLPIIRKLVSDVYVKDTMLLAGKENIGPPEPPSTGEKRKEVHSTPPPSSRSEGGSING